MSNFSKKFHTVVGRSLTELARAFPAVPSPLPPAPDPELGGLRPARRNIQALLCTGQDPPTVASPMASPAPARGGPRPRAQGHLTLAGVGHIWKERMAPSPVRPQPLLLRVLQQRRFPTTRPQKGTGYPGRGSGWGRTGTLAFWALSRNKSNQAADPACPSRTQAWGKQRRFLARRGYTMWGDSAKLKISICLCWYNRSWGSRQEKSEKALFN